MIKANNISVQKGSAVILDHVSMQIAPGCFTAVLGMNGAGKSTLLKAINKQEKLNSGQVLWKDTDLTRIRPHQLAQHRAVLSQNFSPGFPIKVSALVEMGTYPYQHEIDPNEKSLFVKEALREVGLLSFLERDFSSLSGGEQKRILLAKCLVQLRNGAAGNFDKYLFLDEPTSSIDVHHSYKILELVRTWTNRKNIGVLAILHDVNLAAQFADHVIILKDGKVSCQGHPEQVFQTDNLQKSLGINSIIQQHPIYECLHITTLPL